MMSSHPRALAAVSALIGSALFTHGAEFDFGSGAVFQTLPGFEMQLAAGPPLTERPICAVFDDAGRLYVAESSGSNAPVQTQLETRPHSILRLEDTDGDGVFDQRVVFADQMMFPEGVLWVNGALLVSAPPTIWKLTDTDGDGKADLREEWLTQTLTGCANDLHGPYLGRDGWIYWCKGAFAEQTYPRPDGQEPWTTRASHIFRRKWDSPWIEPVMTGGMDNPVEVAFSPDGERFFTTTFLQHPGGGKRDGVIHALYGGVYGKQHGVIDGHPRTGDLLPPLAHLGAAAPSGLMIQEAGLWGGDYQNSLYATLFNMRKIVRLPLNESGASYSTEPEDFLVGSSQDFHPTDVLEDADGSLLVVDTGGWYKICCPTSQLYKPDVPGAIYRIRKSETQPYDQPWTAGLDWRSEDPETFIAALEDERPKVRERAVRRLAALGASAVPSLGSLGVPKPTISPLGRINAVWTLTQIDHPSARTAVREALGDTDAGVRRTALHSISLRKDREALSSTLMALKDTNAAVRRVAAEALGRIGNADSVPYIMEAIAATDSESTDRALDHSLIYSLIEINQPEAIAPFQTSASPTIRKAAWITLRQLHPESLNLDLLFADLAAESEPLRQAARQAILENKRAAEPFGNWIDKNHPVDGSSNWTPYTEMIIRFQDNPTVHQWVESGLERQTQDPESAYFNDFLNVLRSIPADQFPQRWALSILQATQNQNSSWERRTQWTRLLAGVQLDPKPVPFALVNRLLETAQSSTTPVEARIAFWKLAHHFSIQPAGEQIEWLASLLNASQPVTPIIRSEALQTLKAFSKNETTQAQLTAALAKAGPIEVSKILEILKSYPSEAAGQLILQALKKNPAANSISPAVIVGSLQGFPETIQELSNQWLASLQTGQAERQAKLDHWIEQIANHPGDIRRGQKVFNGTKAACYYCHEIGYLGGDLGPDLTRIGSSRSERDLLESILFPGASFVRSYEPFWIENDSGELVLGIIKSESSEALQVAPAPGLTVTIPRSEITDMRPADTSLMPAGLETLLTPQEMSDLIAFLKASR